MTLQAKRIRLEVLNLLLAGSTAAENRIKEDDSTPVRLSEIRKPELRLHVRSEDIEQRGTAPLQFLHRLRLAVEGYVAESANAKDLDGAVLSQDDVADDLVHQILDLLLPKIRLPGIDPEHVALDASACTYEGRETQDEWQGTRPEGTFRLTFVYAYSTQWPEQATATLDALGEFGVDWNLAPPDVNLEAQDTITLPTS